MKMVKGLVMAMALVAAPAFAGDDSSSDAAGGFGASVDGADGVIVKVPINAQGEELVDAAEIALHDGSDVSTSGDFQSAFAQGVAATNAASVSDADISRDSSTSGWYGRGGHRGGWERNYYYNYQPTYYYRSVYISFTVYSYRDYYYPSSGYYGYRYYYHRRCR